MTFSPPRRGFTLIELLVVVAIISLISSVAIASLQEARAQARDADRIAMMNAAQQALEMYYNEHGEYPVAIGKWTHGWDYQLWDSENESWGSVYNPSGDGRLRFDNSSSPGFLAHLNKQGYLSKKDWMDPLVEEDNHGSQWNCRYVVHTPCGNDEEWSALGDSDQERIDTLNNQCDPPAYLIHCNLEAKTHLEETDGGANDDLYEVYGGTSRPWIKPIQP